MPRQPQNPDNTPLPKQAEATRNILVFPALTAMVFLRRDLGYRTVDSRMLGAVTCFVGVLSVVIFTFTDSAKSLALPAFVGVAYALGMKQRFKRWAEIEAGVKQHSHYIGTSPFRFPWLPLFLQRHRRVERFIDPIVIFLFGSVVLFFLRGLGFWLVAAGAGLRVYEAEVHEKELNRNLDMLDGLIVSETQTNVVEKFEEAPKTRDTQLNASVPTGMADDIQERLRRRKAKQPPTGKG